MPYDKQYIMCMPVQGDDVMEVPSNKDICDACGKEVWVSQTMHTFVRNGDMKPVCTDCAQGLISLKSSEDGVEFAIAPEQEAELAELGILDWTKRFVDHLNSQRESK